MSWAEREADRIEAEANELTELRAETERLTSGVERLCDEAERHGWPRKSLPGVHVSALRALLGARTTAPAEAATTETPATIADGVAVQALLRRVQEPNAARVIEAQYLESSFRELVAAKGKPTTEQQLRWMLAQAHGVVAYLLHALHDVDQSAASDAACEVTEMCEAGEPMADLVSERLTQLGVDVEALIVEEDARRALGHTAPSEQGQFGIDELEARVAAGDWIGLSREEAAELGRALTFATGLLHQQLPVIHAARKAVREIRDMRGLSDTARALIAAVDELPSARLAHPAPSRWVADHQPPSLVMVREPNGAVHVRPGLGETLHRIETEFMVFVGDDPEKPKVSVLSDSVDEAAEVLAAMPGSAIAVRYVYAGDWAVNRSQRADDTPLSTSDVMSLETVGVSHASPPDKPGPAETRADVPLVTDWNMPAQVVQLSCVGDPKECGTGGCSMAKDGWNVCQPAVGSGEGQEAGR